MSTDYTTIVTPEARLSFNSLMEPNTTEKGTEYSARLLFPHPDSLTGDAREEHDKGMKALREAIKAAAARKWGKDARGWKNPLRDQGDYVSEKAPQYTEGAVMVRVSTKYAPAVVDGDLQVITDPTQVYDGAYARAAVFASAYEFKDKDSGMVSKGVRLTLVSVQKTRDGDRLAGSGAATDPSEYFGKTGGSKAKKAAPAKKETPAPEADDESIASEDIW